MTRLNSAFGDTQSLRTKTFQLGGHTFKVRIPLSKEMEELQARINTGDPEKIKQRFEKLTVSFKGKEIDGVVVSDEDVVVDGRSTQELARTILMMETRIIEFIKLLVPEAGNLDDITYEEIEAEWPMAVQLDMTEKIAEAIQPGYKDARKN
jgi:hypothetical protein